MRKIILSQGQFKHLIKVIKEQEEEYYKISPQELLNILELASYSSAALKPKFFEGKKLYVTGNLDLSSKPIKTLGNIAYIDGNLNISKTNISSVEGVQVKGYISDYGSPVEAKRIREAELKKLAEAESRREDGDWDLTNPNIDEEGLAANALFDHLVSEGDLDEMDNETKELINNKLERIEELTQQGVGLESDSEERDELYEEIDRIEDEIEELQKNYADVYYIIPTNYKSYGTLYNFEVTGLRNQEYMVGTYDDMYEAAIKNTEELLYDAGLDGINQYIIESNLDQNSIREYIEEFYDNDIRDSPESYFRQDDYELTDEQEERKEQLENYINEMEDLKTELEEKQINLEDSDSEEYELIQTKLDEIEENIDKAQDELDSIEPDTEPTEEMIEEKVSYLAIRAMDNPIRWLRGVGEDDRINYYVNVRGVAEDIVDHDGIGTLSSWDGSYDDVYITGPDGTRYNFVVVRTN
jgi:predicted nuclease with TOPRIM domain